MTGQPTPSEPLVSVIVPAYNYGRFIGQTLECLRGQTYARWECVVVDDGSTDDTVERVARLAALDPRFRLLRQRNARQAAAKNNGLRNSSGDYVQFLDADDLIEPGKLESQVALLESRREVDIVYGDVRFFRTENPGERLYTMSGADGPRMPRVSGAGREVLLALVRANFLVINSALVRRSVVEAVGPFDDRLPPAEDWDYWVRCAAAGARFQFDDSPGTMSLVRVHPSSSSQDRLRMYASMLLMREKIGRLTDDAGIRELNRELMSEEQGTLALEALARAPRGECLTQMFRAGLRSRRRRQRLKWLACACAAPFLPRRTLRALVTGSLTRPRPGG